MFKKIYLFFIFAFLSVILTTSSVSAATGSYVNIVNPVRGGEFWDINEAPEVGVQNEFNTLRKANLTATWLLRFDALNNEKIINLLKPSSDEKGLFLEITPTLTEKANVPYNKSANWHQAGSIFLTGYSQENRVKIIDSAFESFKQTFGYYPKSVGAWWIDSYSLDYMQKKYQINAALIVADQYSTDNYQIWGQYWGTPYYPSLKDALDPAQSKENKIPVVITQWAARDPVNGYGKGVEESTLSVQANDYIDYHSLGIDYFSKLIDVYTNQQFNQVNQIVVGLENSYSWNKYGNEYENQIKVLADKKSKGQFSVTTMNDFALWYKNKFTDISPPQIIVSDDPLGTAKKSVWFMNPYYRAGWFYNQEGSVISDLRQYIQGDEEICYSKSCNELNFATFTTRVLDEVTYGQKWIIDEGKIRDFKALKEGSNYVLSYTNEADQSRRIDFLPRDISVNGDVSTIDGAILDVARSLMEGENKVDSQFGPLGLKLQAFSFILDSFKFGLFVIFFIFLPGLVLLSKIRTSDKYQTTDYFLSLSFGVVLMTLLSFISGMIYQIWLLPLISGVLALTLFIVKGFYKKISKPRVDVLSFILIAVIILGSLFQLISVLKSGLIFEYGMGFWGPNGHDGVWHISLVNELIKGVPPQNPILSGTKLENYHYFYDLMVAVTSVITSLNVTDLIFRFFSFFISISLGWGTYCLIREIYSNYKNEREIKYISIFALFFVYFAGSFGWIADYIRKGAFEGESAFWINQSVSFNLNPPFAISLVLMVATFILLSRWLKDKSFTLALILGAVIGSLLEFKAYSAILIFLSFGLMFVFRFFVPFSLKNFKLVTPFVIGMFISGLLLLPSYNISKSSSDSLLSIFIFSPFWFIHSMVEASDRVPIQRLYLARIAGLENKDWVKFIGAETIGLLLFIAGNLGIRIIGLLALIKSRKYLKDPMFLFLMFLTLTSFLIPILFIQKGTPWNTIQFSYYGLYLISIFSGVFLSFIYLKWPKWLGLPIVAILLLLTPVNSVTTALSYNYPLPHAYIPAGEIEGLNFLKSEDNQGVVLTYPYDKGVKRRIKEPYPLYAYETSAYVSALSQKRVYVEDEIQQSILQLDDNAINDVSISSIAYKNRLVQVKDFFKGRDKEWSMRFLKENKIRYIYLPSAFRVTLDQEQIDVEKVFSNKEVDIFEVK